MKREIVRPEMIADMIVSVQEGEGRPVSYRSFVVQGKCDASSWGPTTYLGDEEVLKPENLSRIVRAYVSKQGELFPATEAARDVRVIAGHVESINQYVNTHPSVGKVESQPKQQRAPAERSGLKIELPPGYQVAAIASFILTKGAYQRYVAPHIADMQFEYIEALDGGDERRARWVRVRGYGLIVWALFGSVLRSLTTLLVRSTK